MKLSIASLLVVGATASSSSIRANSKTGQKMLSSARRLDGGDDNMSWAANYSLRFEKCATTNDYYGGYFGGNQNNENNNNQANYNGLYQQRLVHFKLCPSDSCSSGCSGGGDYVMDMNEFVMAYMEYKQEAQEAQCESVANSCYCEDANDDEVCQSQCWSNAGIYELCVDQDEQNNNNGQQEEEFAVEDALECVQLEIDEEAAQYYNYNQNGNNNQNYNYNNGQNNNNNQNGQQDVEFFVGPYCSANGKNIILGVFMDETCSYSAPTGVYEKYHYGKSLPYSSESIISNDCISCMQPAEEDENENQNNNNNNNNQNYNNNNGDYNYNYNQEEQEEPEVLEFCTNLYQDAGKCESSMNIYNHWPNTMACEFIQGLNPWGKTRIFSSFAEAKKNVTPGVLAGVFAVTTAAFGGVSYFLHRKLQRQSVGLVHGQGGSLA